MLRVSCAAAVVIGTTLLWGADPDRDFSGKWIQEAPSGDALRVRPAPAESLLVTQTPESVECETAAGRWSYALDGSDQKAVLGGETWNSAAKWEGAALLVNALVSGPQNYTVMDRWELVRNQSQLIVTRQVMRSGSTAEGQFYYRREGAGTEATTPAGSTGLARRAEPSIWLARWT